MEKRIFYTNNNGKLCQVIPTPEALSKMTIEEIAAKDVPSGKTFKIVDVSQIPQDRYFRDAWEESSGTVVENPAKCKTLKIEFLRKEREEKWKIFDKKYLVAQRDGLSLTNLDTQRQKLKDVTTDVSLNKKTSETDTEYLQRLKTFRPAIFDQI